MKKWIGIGLTVATLGILTWMIVSRIGDVQEAREGYKVPVEARPVAVSTEEAVQREFVRELELSAELNAKASVYVFAKIGGRLEEVFVDLGDEVSEGQILARVEENDLAWRVEQGEAAERAARAGVRQARTQLDVIRREHERAKALYGDGAMAEADYTQVDGHLKAAQAAVAAAQAQVGVAEAGAGLATEARTWTQIESPLTGIVTAKMVSTGDMVGGQPPHPLFEVQDQSELKLTLNVPAEALPSLKVGETVKFTVDGRPHDRFDAEIRAVGKSLNPMTRRLQVELKAEGALVDEGALPGMLATAYVTIGEGVTWTAVPRSALILRDGQPLVYVANGDVAREVQVEIEAEDATHYGVAGLEAGAQLVVVGQSELRDGRKLQVAPAAKADTPEVEVQP